MKRLSLFLLLLVFSFFTQAVFAGSGGPAKQVPISTTGPTIWDAPETDSVTTIRNVYGSYSDTHVAQYDWANPEEGALEACAAANWPNPPCGAVIFAWNSYNHAYGGTSWGTYGYNGSSYSFVSSSSTTAAQYIKTDETDTNRAVKTLSNSTVSTQLYKEFQDEEKEVTTVTTVDDRTDYYSRTDIDHYYTDPLILDLDGMGLPDVPNHIWLPHVPLFHREGAVVFDISGDGTPILTEWLGSHSGLLCVPDKNGNVTSAKEIFGTYGGFENGYEKLSLRDKNHDGKIEGDELKGLYVWRDLNGNGKVDSGELVSVQALGITSISLDYHNYQSTYVRNGKTYKTWDWWPSGMRVVPARNGNQL